MIAKLCFRIIAVLILFFVDLRITAWEYPMDDYESPVNFSKAVPVADDDVILVCFNQTGAQVGCTELMDQSTKVLIHGWMTSIQLSPWYSTLKDAYLSLKEPINVIYVDYAKIAQLNYSILASTTRNVGKVIAKKLIKLPIDVQNFHLLGHSIGGHVAGFAGKEVTERFGQKLGRITLLDAAGKKFDRSPERAGKDDARFVDAIHTDGHFGLKTSVGHVDLFPNGGLVQPGCPSLQVDENCNHARSTLLYVESVMKKPKVCRRAESWEKFKQGKYLDDTVVVFGEFISKEARGNYYLTTRGEPDFFN